MNQHAFATALLNPDAPIPPGVTGPDGRPDAKRFAVYRNNVASSLTRALEAAFPVIRQLVGDRFFGAMAVEFLRAHPPRHRQLALYGAEFPGFLESFPPVAHLGYLPDMARLEQALRDSYHAADSTPLPPDALVGLSETQLLGARLSLAPALRLVVSPWPIHAIWAANVRGGAAPHMEAQEVAILRVDYDPAPYLLAQGGAAFLRALQAGEPLMAALSRCPADFDLQATLGLLLQTRAITGVTL
jgi:Putative DNA-binding domain